MNKTTALSLAALIVMSPGCEKVRKENAREAEKAYVPGTPKTLTVVLKAQDQASYYKVKRYYDTDGDLKTVEQYIEFYGIGREGAHFTMTEVLKNVVRPGIKNIPFTGEALYATHGFGSDSLRRDMTKEEEKEIDAIYAASVK